jgi:hypothetical protein
MIRDNATPLQIKTCRAGGFSLTRHFSFVQDWHIAILFREVGSKGGNAASCFEIGFCGGVPYLTSLSSVM